MARVEFWHKTYLLKYILRNLQESHKGKWYTHLTSHPTSISKVPAAWISSLDTKFS